MVTNAPIVLHAAWIAGALHLWAESGEHVGRGAASRDRGADEPPGSADAHDHPFAVDPLEALVSCVGAAMVDRGRASRATLRLPTAGGTPTASTRLSLALGRGVDFESPAALQAWSVPTRCFDAAGAAAVLEALQGATEGGGLVGANGSGASTVAMGGSVEFYGVANELARSIMAQQRVIPMVRQGAMGELEGVWQPWLSDEANASRVARLLGAMPASARAGVDAAEHRAWAVLGDFLLSVTDARCRGVLTEQDFLDAVRERDAGADAHVAWLQGLLGSGHAIQTSPSLRQEIPRRVRGWIGLLEERSAAGAWRLCLGLDEPTAGPSQAEEDVRWRLSFLLQSVERPGVMIDAEDVWLLQTGVATIQGLRVDSPQDLLLAELGRVSRLYRKVEGALEDSNPTGLTLTTREAYEFLREIRPLLTEQGFGVRAPDWYDSPYARLGARLRIEGDPREAGVGAGRSTGAAGSQVGLGALVKYRWEIAVGDTTLSLKEFEQLAAKRTPLVRIDDRWVEIRPEDVEAAIRFIRDNPGGEMKIADALRLAYASDLRDTGIPVVGLEASGWLHAFLNSEAASATLATVESPATFHGTLRPYQVRGVSWMLFMERLGFGLCLADDMGLGKTVQLLALLAHERAEPAPPGSPGPGPTLLIVPMSVVGNWMHETRRFCPSLRVLVHHGADRTSGEELAAAAGNADLVVTTYALAHRDREALASIPWHRVVLDEAQYIKNAGAKQAQAVRALKSDRRVALTGTPVENRLTELWSIMDFLNPGYLGSAAGFRTRFGVAVERFHDRHRSEQLRGLIRPFVLRRLKTDPTVVADLPEKVETREFCHLTSEQAALYESCVRRMLTEIDEAEGIQRRGLVLSALVRLKQICNHPSQVLDDADDAGPPPDASRSGKCLRLVDMLDEIIAEGDRVLVFTQFRQMGHLLQRMLRHRLGRDVLFLHGGTTQPQREAIIESFQKTDHAPVLLLSLKAGGVGLNLTAATHVFHFDRWWNPAVENQATDRAFRIGQKKNVLVHKFVCRGTIEDRIDQLIESKRQLVKDVLEGGAEVLLTEMSDRELLDLVRLDINAAQEV